MGKYDYKNSRIGNQDIGKNKTRTPIPRQTNLVVEHENQDSICQKKIALKTWKLPRSSDNFRKYKAQKSSPEKPSHWPNQHTTKVYDELTNREGKTKIYKLATSRNRATQDIDHVTTIKDEDNKLLWDPELILHCNARRGTSNKSQMKNFPILQSQDQTINQYPDPYRK